ncbi:MAG: hypothetical protein Q8R40_02860 [bacterium]|nr:hypothetical protein [bacterium]
MATTHTLFKTFSAASILFLLVFFMSASLAWAQNPCVKVGDTYTCGNPIKAADVVALIDSVVAQVQPFAIAIITFLIIWFGFKYILAARTGNAQQITNATTLLSKTFLVAAIVGGAVVIVNAVVKFAQEFK